MTVKDLESTLQSVNHLIPHTNKKGFLYLAQLYFKPKEFEWSGRFYESIGIKKVGRLARTVAIAKSKLTGKEPRLDTHIIREYSSNSVRIVLMSSWAYEAIHLAGSIGSAYYLIKGEYGPMGAVVGGALFAVNAATTLLQRYNRVKTYKSLAKIVESQSR